MKIAEIDHIHLYVENIEQAETWYNKVLGFSRDNALYFWFEQGGPLVIRNNRASLSLFLRSTQLPGHTVAFCVAASSFSELIPVLRDNKIPFTVSDHAVSMSVYFSDLSDNKIEITSYDYVDAKQILERLA
ncbi:MULTISPECIES: VOC family protein [unclassified Pantoea]|jgi:catechol-2,3-dioxygenase|uniref:VOC family protein n=1 Tax=unclassified Pantoea TaxID=2630326 RepID=UPI0023DBCBC7|nr:MULTISPECIES: VOC family protein [unclassified Pantoea]MDF2043237.1 VOC family protein [Pantoea sp. Cr_R14]MDF2069734.1 VOC family protein [Pantoea sp. Cr_R13]MDF2079241.1 VOC family protein [Pantoea sp. Cr_R21]